MSSSVHRHRSLLLFLAVLAFFFVSGGCGLVYQVVWTRKLVLLFGTTSYAVSTVLSIFFLGLGLGSLWGGRIADRTRNALRLYAVFEVGIGLWAVFFLVAVGYGEGLIAGLLTATAGTRALGLALRALLALVLVLPPVMLMGATLPLLARFVNEDAQVRGVRIGTLYTVNTLGAMAGCFTAGFYLLPSHGYMAATLVGAAANVLVGLVALGVAAGRNAAPPVADAGNEGGPVERSMPAPARRVALSFAVSGFSVLALEVIWTRLLTIIFLGTTYAYTTMLTTLLFGIVAGSGIASLFVDRVRSPRHWFGVVLIAGGFLSIGTLATLDMLPDRVHEMQQTARGDFGSVVRGTFLLCSLALLPAMLFLGATFPLAAKAYLRAGATVGKDLGRLYFWNTLGGVLGAAAGGFVLIPLLGTREGLLLCAVLLVLCGFINLVFTSKIRRSIVAIGLLLSLAAGGQFVLFSAWDNTSYLPEDHRVIHYDEGVEGTVVVSEPEEETRGTNRVLWINRVQATTSIERGVRMNRFQGALPHVFDRDIENVLFMCFGSGITCGTLAQGGFAHIDAVEISGEVLEAAPLFAADNLRVWEQPNVQFHLDDGRNFLMTSAKQYDFITFEPMPLALAGVSTFYTREYYDLCLAKLAPRGLVSQWVPLHSLSPELVQSLAYTFTTVFPEHCAFFINADLFLIGSNAPIAIDLAAAERRLFGGALGEALRAAGFLDAESIIGTFVLDKAGMTAYAAGGRVMTDDLPWAEFLAPKLVYARAVPDSVTALQGHVSSPLPLLSGGESDEQRASLERRHAALVHDLEALKEYYGGFAIGTRAAELFMESLRIDPQDTNARYYLTTIAEQQGERMIDWEEFEEARAFLEQVLQFLPENEKLKGFYREAGAAR